MSRVVPRTKMREDDKKIIKTLLSQRNAHNHAAFAEAFAYYARFLRSHYARWGKPSVIRFKTRDDGIKPPTTLLRVNNLFALIIAREDHSTFYTRKKDQRFTAGSSRGFSIYKRACTKSISPPAALFRKSHASPACPHFYACQLGW